MKDETRKKWETRAIIAALIALASLVIVLALALFCVSFALVMGPDVEAKYQELFEKRREKQLEEERRKPKIPKRDRYWDDSDNREMDGEEDLNDEGWEEDSSSLGEGGDRRRWVPGYLTRVRGAVVIAVRAAFI
jgi:flagellar biosynthesis/type III secretory pathway M-ring protein FliF/YscJ